MNYSIWLTIAID